MLKKGLVTLFFFTSIAFAYGQTTPKPDQVYQVVEHMPEFAGGYPGMEKFISDSTRYPKEAFANKIEGTVFVQFVVDTNAKVTQTKITYSPNPLLGEEALRVVNSMQPWTAGKQNGKKANVLFSIPVPFHLDGKYRIDFPPRQEDLKLK